MTDNEKRAHDLALTFSPEYVEKDIEELVASLSTGKDSRINANDYYNAYKVLYDAFLANFKRDFPSSDL